MESKKKLHQLEINTDTESSLFNHVSNVELKLGETTLSALYPICIWSGGEEEYKKYDSAPYLLFSSPHAVRTYLLLYNPAKYNMTTAQ